MKDDPKTMTRHEYKALRERLGSRRVVGAALGRHPKTIAMRERGAVPITHEYALALTFLACHGLGDDARTWLRAGRPNTYGKPGELREALAILGLGTAEAARSILGPRQSHSERMSRMLAGSRPVSEDVARLVKRRLGLNLEDPWPTRESRAYDNTAAVVAGLEAKG
ncbi:MAG: hypothetical protein KAJ19_21755 [Gammaproteobacteria bacterium]|nr:hypothetical protein [Gammaproteobacteria bacterium]